MIIGIRRPDVVSDRWNISYYTPVSYELYDRYSDTIVYISRRNAIKRLAIQYHIHQTNLYCHQTVHTLLNKIWFGAFDAVSITYTAVKMTKHTYHLDGKTLKHLLNDCQKVIRLSSLFVCDNVESHVIIIKTGKIWPGWRYVYCVD